MRLTWRDAAATAATGALTTLWFGQVTDADWAPVTSVRWLAASAIALGLSACIVGAGDIANSDDMSGPAMVLGPTAAFSLIAALLLGYGPLVALGVAATVALWLLATVRHLTTRPEQHEQRSADATSRPALSGRH